MPRNDLPGFMMNKYFAYRFFRAARFLRLVGLLGVMIVALTACGSGGGNGDGSGNGNGGGGDGGGGGGFPEPPGRPGFTSTVAGGDTTFSGAARHGIAHGDEAASPGGFVIRLEDAGDASGASILLFAEAGRTPAPGGYAIGPHVRAGDFAALVTLPGRADRRHVVAGRLTITQRVGDRLEGHFRFELEEVADGPLTTVSGAFASEANR